MSEMFIHHPIIGMPKNKRKLFAIQLPNARVVRAYFGGRILDIYCPIDRPCPDVQRRIIRFRRYVRRFQRRRA